MYIKEPIDEHVGSARIIPSGPAIAGSWGTWTVVYTTGLAGLEINAPVRFSIPSGFTHPQLKDPQAPGFVTLSCSNPKVALEAWVETSGIPYLTPRVCCRIPYRSDQEITLKPGETITVVYGDRSPGGPGAKVQYFSNRVEFTVAVDRHGMYGNFRRIKDSPQIEVVSDKATRLFVMGASIIKAGVSFPLKVTARDAEDNVALSLSGEAKILPGTGLKIEKESPVSIKKGKAETNIELIQPGLHQIRVEFPSGLKGLSNPIKVMDQPPEYHLYWGDTHTMTGISCGEYSANDSVRDILDYAYTYAREEAALDFAAVTDMDFDVRDSDFAETIAAARRHYRPGNFVTFPGYEYCERIWDGDRTVLFLEEDSPIYRASEPGSNTLPALWAKLGNRKALTTPHHPVSSRVGTRWLNHHPKFQRLVEIYSSWGDSEKPGVERALKRPANYREQSVQAGLAKGYRLGIVANSDSHTGQPGFSSWMFSYRGYRGGLTAVYAQELTREAIFEALYERRAYGTTHARILLDFRLNGLMMGSETKVELGNQLLLTAEIVGTEKIKEVAIVKNNVDIQTIPGEKEGAEIKLEYRELKSPNRTDYYYLRVIQEDGERAWSSPIWVDLASFDQTSLSKLL